MRDSERHERLDRLAEEFVRRYQAGEHPSLDEYAERHPDLADDIRRLFPTLVPAKGDAESASPVPPSRSAESTVEQRRHEALPSDALSVELPAERLGGYRILREVVTLW